MTAPRSLTAAEAEAKHSVSWEFIDGGSGRTEFATLDDAETFLDTIIAGNVRLWLDDNQVQRGFIASDE